MRVRVLAGCVAGLILLAACRSGDNAAPVPPRVYSVDVSPAQLELAPGASHACSALARDASGQGLPQVPVSWESGDPSVATVSATGLVQALQEGEAEIRATAAGVIGRATLRVSAVPRTVARVVVEPASLHLAEGGQGQLGARALAADGSEIHGRGVSWTSLDSGTASVAPDGRVSAIRVGQTTVSARIDGRSDSAAVKVSAEYPYRLLFDASPGPGSTPELFSLDISDPAATPVALLPAGPRAEQVAISPTGGQMAFVVPEGSSRNIFIAAVDGSGLRRLTGEPGFNDQPAWSPDGLRIAFRRWPDGEDADIWVIDADGQSPAINLTPDTELSGEHEPSWSDERIAFARIAQGFGSIWYMRPDGSDTRQLSAGGELFDSQPSWSPDGRFLVFQRVREGVGANLWRMNADGSGQVLLLDLPGPQSHPRYSPDAQLIAFISGGYPAQIMTVRADGRGPVARSSGQAHHAGPGWLSLP